MERYCNCLKPAIKSRRFPYTTIDRYIFEDAQLTQIKAIYDLAEELALKPPKSALPWGAYKSPYCESHALIPSQSRSDFAR